MHQQKHKVQVKRLMAYLYMPLAFSLIAYLVIYFAARPIIDTGIALSSLVLSDSASTFKTDVGSIFDEEQAKLSLEADNSTVPLSEVDMPSYGEQYGEIKVDRIGLEAPLYYGDDLDIMEYGICQNMSSSMPGFDCPILLSGHNNTFCYPLKDIEVGDIIVITTNYGTYQYKVNNLEIHSETDKSAYNLTRDRERLIMFTCYPFMTTLYYKSERLYVYADKISGPVIEY